MKNKSNDSYESKVGNTLLIGGIIAAIFGLIELIKWLFNL